MLDSWLVTAMVWVAGLCSWTATLMSLAAVWSHCKNYSQPNLQRWVVRIILMVPIYALTAWASLISIDSSYYLDTLRDVYEAYVIYCFVSLLIAYFGGERAFLLVMHDRPPTPLFWPASLFRKDLDLSDPYDYLFLKRGILQYVLVKPILAASTMLMKSLDLYTEGNWGLMNGYLWTQLVYNLSVSLSLYCLVVFYMATRQDLAQWNPLPKFLCIKAIVFFSYWQGLGISILVGVGLIHDTAAFSADHIAVFLQSWLICLEMIGGAIGHWVSFSYLDYVPMFRLAGRLRLFHAVRDALGLKDVFLDAKGAWSGHLYTYHHFDPIVPVDELDTQMPLPAPQRKRTISSSHVQNDDESPEIGNSKVGPVQQASLSSEIHWRSLGSTPAFDNSADNDSILPPVHSSGSSASLSSSIQHETSTVSSEQPDIVPTMSALPGFARDSSNSQSTQNSNSGGAAAIKERRLRAGMRYTQGGKKIYWLPIEQVDHRAMALAAGGAGGTRARLLHGDYTGGSLRTPFEYIGHAVHPTSRVSREGRRVNRQNELDNDAAVGVPGTPVPEDLVELSMDLDPREFIADDGLYAEARGVEGDFNYPVMEVGVQFGYSRRRPYGHTFSRRRSSLGHQRPVISNDLFHQSIGGGYGSAGNYGSII